MTADNVLQNSKSSGASVRTGLLRQSGRPAARGATRYRTHPAAVPQTHGQHAQVLVGVSRKLVHVVEHRTDRASLLQEMKGSLDLLRALGVEVKELVPIEVIGAESEVVSTKEGLEDIL